MEIEEELQSTKKIFDLLFKNEILKDNELEQLKRIHKIIERLNNGEVERIRILDELTGEVFRFREIIVDKYMRIGSCLDRGEGKWTYCVL